MHTIEQVKELIELEMYRIFSLGERSGEHTTYEGPIIPNDYINRAVSRIDQKLKNISLTIAEKGV